MYVAIYLSGKLAMNRSAEDYYEPLCIVINSPGNTNGKLLAVQNLPCAIDKAKKESTFDAILNVE